MIEIGQVWRHTDGDNRRLKRGQRSDWRNQRLVKVVAQEADGRWVLETVRSRGGRDVENGRKSRCKADTLTSTYELQPNPAP